MSEMTQGLSSSPTANIPTDACIQKTSTDESFRETYNHIYEMAASDEKINLLENLIDKAKQSSCIPIPALVATMYDYVQCCLKMKTHLYKARELAQEAVIQVKQKFDKNKKGTRHLCLWVMKLSQSTALYACENFQKAAQAAKKCVEQSKQIFGLDHPQTVLAMRNYGFICNKIDTKASIATLQETLELAKTVFGEEHEQTLRIMRTLGLVEFTRGNVSTARQVWHTCLEGRRRHSTNTVSPWTTLDVFESLSINDFVDKLRQYQSQQKALGPLHPDTLKLMSDLAFAYENFDKDVAISLLEECFEKQQYVLGPEHNDTLTTMHNLVLFLPKTEKSLQMARQCLEKRRNILGFLSLHTLSMMRNIAIHFEPPERETLLRECLSGHKQIFGPRHLATLDTMYSLARCLGPMSLEGLTLIQECYESRRELLGSTHPDTLMAMYGYGCTILNQSDLSDWSAWSKGAELLETCLQAERRVWGPTHPNTLQTAAALAAFYKTKFKSLQTDEKDAKKRKIQIHSC